MQPSKVTCQLYKVIFPTLLSAKSLIDLVHNVSLLAILLPNQSILGLELHKASKSDVYFLSSAGCK